jgi:hypothetical protein
LAWSRSRAGTQATRAERGTLAGELACDGLRIGALGWVLLEQCEKQAR